MSKSFTLCEEAITIDKKLYAILKANPKYYGYGTAGFRFKNELMEPISFRVGLFMDILAKYFFPEALGIVITASHNPKGDNGIKLVNHEGEMLEACFEGPLNKFINTEDISEAYAELVTSIEEHFKDKKPQDKGLIFIAKDTRESGPVLFDLIKKKATSEIVDYGLLATPILFYLVYHYNEELKKDPNASKPSTDVYFDKISKGYVYNMERFFKQKKFNLMVDCSNGVGSLMLDKFLENEKLKKYFNPIAIYNKDHSKLNEACGAEYVHKGNKATEEFLATPETDDEFKNFCFVLDGDADRCVVFERIDKTKPEIRVADGTILTALYGRTLCFLLEKIYALSGDLDSSLLEELKKKELGVVYGGYTNQGFVNYATNTLKVGGKFSNTGIKNAHVKAKEFDVGVMFEPNGHGSIIFRRSYMNLLESLHSSAKTEEAKTAVYDLQNYLENQNYINGDAIGNVLLVLSSLEILSITQADMYTMYENNPSITSKVPLRDRNLMKADPEDERRLIQPKSFFDAVTEMLQKEFPGYIGFVRPSGTEDIARVYVEGKDFETCQKLEARLKQMITDHPELK